MNSRIFSRWLLGAALSSVVALTSCVTHQVKRAVAESQAALIARNDGSLVAGKNGATTGDEARETAVAQLEELRLQFPANQTAVHANILFRIAMVKTSGGLSDDANDAWKNVAGYNNSLNKDQAALFSIRTSLVWFFAKGEKADLYTPETSGHFAKREKADAVNAAAAFQRIAANEKISPQLRLWGAYHRAFIAYKFERSGLTDPGLSLPAARQDLKTLHAVVGASSLDTRITRLQSKHNYDPEAAAPGN